jgi:hypothetical protein
MKKSYIKERIRQARVATILRAIAQSAIFLLTVTNVVKSDTLQQKLLDSSMIVTANLPFVLLEKDANDRLDRAMKD